MSLLLWLSLVFLGVVTIGGIVLIARRVIELIRVSRSSGRVIAASAERILNAAERVEQRATTGAPDRVGHSVERLQRSLAEASVLAREARRVKAELDGFREAVPRK
jgi:hypothetical protein